MEAYDPAETARAAQQAHAQNKHAADQEAEDFKKLMEVAWGRRIVWRLLQRTGVFRTSFAIEGTEMAFNEGRRNEGLYLMALIQTHTPSLLDTMIVESKEHEESPA